MDLQDGVTVHGEAGPAGPVEDVRPACEHVGALEVRPDGKHCAACGALIYPAVP